MNKKLINPYFAVSINENLLQNFRNSIMNLDQITKSKVTFINNPHITLNYSVGVIDSSLVENVILNLSGTSFSINITGATTIFSRHYNQTMIVLKLKNSPEYLNMKHDLKEKLNHPRFSLINQKMKSLEFDAHISLALIPTLDNKTNHQFKKDLNQLNLTGILKGESICVFNPYREKVLSSNLV